MNIELIKKYKINFQNKIDDGEVIKMPYTNFFAVTGYLYQSNLSRVDVYLAEINDALNDVDTGIESGNEISSAVICKNEVVFSDYELNESSMPTVDLKLIVEGWREFLLTPPLQGTKV